MSETWDKDDAAQDAALAEAVLARDLSELERTVATMRRLGVARWRDVVLGPEPQTFTPRIEEPAVAEAKRAQRAAEERHRTLFASSRVVPPLPGKPSNFEAHAAARKAT